MKIPDAKAAVDKPWENREKNGMAADESQKQKGDDRGSKERKQNGALRVIDGHLTAWTKITKNTEAELYSQETLSKMIQAQAVFT